MAESSPKKARIMSPTSFSEDEHIEQPSFSLATLGLQRVGTVPPPKPQANFPKQALNARGMPARIRKRNRLFFDENIINDDKPLRVSLSPRKTPSKAANSMVQQHASMSSPKTPSKSVKLQKSTSNKNDAKHKNVAIYEPNKNAEKIIHPKDNSAKLLDVDTKLLIQRMKSFLRLPKPRAWLSNEFFTSFIDQTLLEGENDFQKCLKELMPNLHSNSLTREEWIYLRSLMGKPRRLSARFVAEERDELEKKRKKVRYIQANRAGEYKDLSFLRDLPEKIPLPLPVGTRVQARLYGKKGSVKYGTVEAFNSQESSYRVTFDGAGEGKRTIHDWDLKSENFFEMLPLQSISKEYRPLQPVIAGLSTQVRNPMRMEMRGLRSALNMNLNKSDPLLGQDMYASPYKNPVLQRENINGRPMPLLEHLVRLKNALINKEMKIKRLRDMNDEAELCMTHAGNNNPSLPNYSSDESSHIMEMTANGTYQFNEDFQRRYASNIISMERVNRDVQDYLYVVQSAAKEVARDPQEQAMLAPTYLREKCREEAELYCAPHSSVIKNQKILNLIKDLTTLLVVASHLGGTEGCSVQAPKVLEGCMEEVKSKLYNVNVDKFQKNVQLHFHHIRLGIGKNALSAPSNTSSANNTIF